MMGDWEEEDEEEEEETASDFWTNTCLTAVKSNRQRGRKRKVGASYSLLTSPFRHPGACNKSDFAQFIH